jgi:hypothetical protein
MEIEIYASFRTWVYAIEVNREPLAQVIIRYIWLSMPDKRLLKSFNAEVYLHGNGKPPR